MDINVVEELAKNINRINLDNADSKMDFENEMSNNYWNNLIIENENNSKSEINNYNIENKSQSENGNSSEERNISLISESEIKK